MDGFDADEEDEEVESDKEMGLDDEDGDGVNNFDPQSFAEVSCHDLDIPFAF